MSRVSFSSARTGKRQGGKGGNMLKTLEYKMGERKRLVFPIYQGGLILFAKPYHPVKKGALELVKSNGSGKYAINKVRCMHPYSQTTPEESLKAAKSGEICIFCDIAKYESRRQWETIREEFGENGFSELSKKEMKAYFEEMEESQTVETSYYKEEDEEGNKDNRTLMDIFILALEIQLDKKGKPLLDDKGLAKYEPLIMPASKSRLSKFKQGVDDAIASGTLEEDRLHGFIENEGTEAEEEVLIGYVDFLVSFPKEADKMTSGRNMTATPVSESNSVDIDELIEDFEKKAEEMVKSAENLVNNFYVNLKPHTRESGLEMLVQGAEYFEELEEEYRMHGGIDEDTGRELPDDDASDKEIIEKVLSRAKDEEDDEGGAEEQEEEKPKKNKSSKGKDDKKRKKPARQEVDEDDDGEDEDEEEVEPKPKKKKKKDSEGKSKKGKDKKKSKKVKEPEEDEELDDDEFDDEMFDVE